MSAGSSIGAAASDSGASTTSAISGIIDLWHGANQRKQGNRLLNGLGGYPLESVPQDVLDNQAIARQNANTGLPSAQYSQAQQNIKQQQMAALGASQDRRGGLALIGQLQNQGNAADLNLDVANGQQRLKNENTLMDVNNQVAGWKDKVWDNNVKQKYIRDYNYAMGLVGQGNANMQTGLHEGAASVGQGVAGAGALVGGAVDMGGGM